MERERATRRLLIVAGEASGDAHGAALVRELLRQEPALEVEGLGGPRMRAAGVRLLQDLTRHAVTGLAGVVGNFAGFLSAYHAITHALSTARPAAIILIDFPGFNLGVARHARKVGVPALYYVSPQVWAWGAGRIRKITRRVRKMIVFFEFERELYERAGVDVVCVGHPLLDIMAEKLDVSDRAAVRRSLGLPESGTVIGLLPGSRRKEIEHVFPLLLDAAAVLARERPGLTFVVAQADALRPALFRQVARRHGVRFDLVAGRTYDVMLASDLLLACSGTATLEAGLLRTPMVVTYKTDPLSRVVFGPLIRLGSYALVNIVAGEQVVPEFYALDAKPRRIAAAAAGLLDGGLDDMRLKLSVVRQRLGAPGASARAAAEILKLI